MRADNIISEDQLKETRECPYCGTDFPKSESCFDGNFHYKDCVCQSCGKRNHLKVDFIGSGDDDHDARKLDEMIDEVE